MKKCKMLTAFTLVFTAILCICCVATGKAEEETGRKLFVYLEGDKDSFQDAEWMGRIADAVSGAVFLYRESEKVSIEVYKVAQSWETDQGKPVTIGSYASDKSGFRKLLSDLTSSTFADKARLQRSNDKLFNSGIEKMIRIAQEVGDSTLLVFSNSAYKSWYPAANQKDVKLILVSKDPEGVDDDVLSNAMEMSSVDLAVTIWKKWSESDEVPVRKEQSMNLVDSQYINEQKILADGRLMNEQDEKLGNLLSNLTLYTPDEGGYNGEIHADGVIAVLNTIPSCQLSVDVSQKVFDKRENISFQAHIYDEKDGTEMYVSEWNATAHLINEAGVEVDQTEVQKKHKVFSGSFSVEQGGQYEIRMDVQNPAWFDKTQHAESEVFTVQNQAPVSNLTSAIDLPIWIADGETDDYEFIINPEEYWNDDNSLTELTFELVGKSASVDIDDHTLYIHKAFLRGQEEISILPRDIEGDAGDPVAIRICPVRVNDVFVLNYTMTPPDMDGQYGKYHEILLEGSIDVVKDNLPGYENEWKVSATLKDAKGNTVSEPDVNMQGMKFSLTAKAINSGNYLLEMVAENTKMGGWKISNQVGMSVRNEKPVFVGTDEDLLIDVWANSIVNEDAPVQINYAELFHDDGDDPEKKDTSSLNYSLDVRECEGIILESNGLLTIDPKIINQSWEIHIVAEDEEGEKNVQQLIINRWDIPTLLADASSWTASLTWMNSQKQEMAYKDTPLAIQAKMSFADGVLLKYWKSLGTAVGEFEGFPVKIDLMHQDYDNMLLQTKNVMLKWDEENQYFCGSATFDRSRKAGDVIAVLHMGEKFANQDIGSLVLRIMERSPVVANNVIETTILIPGPLFLNTGLNMQPYEIDLAKQVQSEVLDELRINISGLKDGRLYSLSTNKYLYTDKQNFENEEVPELIWTPETEKTCILQLESVNWGEQHISVTISDKEQNNGDSILIHMSVEYKNQKTLLIIGIIIATLIVAATAAIIIHEATKPSFDQNCRVCVTSEYGSTKTEKKEVWLSKWRKKEISLRNILIYCGISIIGEISFDACDKVFLLPAKHKGEKEGYCLKNNASQEEIQIYIGSSMQTERKIYPHQGDTIEIVFRNKECKLLLQVIQDNEEQ